MKSKAVYYRGYNAFLNLCSKCDLAHELPTMSGLSQTLAISRTTVRSILAGVAKVGIIKKSGSAYRLTRRPRDDDFFPDVQTLSTSATVERQFLEWILEGNVQAGELLTTTELARRFDTSTTTIREHLPHLQHLGLLERRPNSAWLFKGVTSAFANEIYEVREMFELRAMQSLLVLDESSPPWKRIYDLRKEHMKVLRNADKLYHHFAELDERLHRTIHETSQNRFIVDFYDVISMLFHYNYRWDPIVEKHRANVALKEHILYIDAIISRDMAKIESALRSHLNTSRENLVRTIERREQAIL
ncbi:GntR family transcriptional regulator [Bradyrhizobium mercantei]|uniref:GntR family transcriptional regulator n=1 Tax=Bradyrhizobium mercantei TaxID=1904807 RepID=UPI000976D7EA|nr:GntR family transcriptional regulator [Bradyrhizobium mercantei]